MAMIPSSNFHHVSGLNNAPQMNFSNPNFQFTIPPAGSPQVIVPPRPSVAMHVVPEQHSVPRINVDPVTAFSQVIPSLVARPPPPIPINTNPVQRAPQPFQQPPNWNSQLPILNQGPNIANQGSIPWKNEPRSFCNQQQINNSNQHVLCNDGFSQYPAPSPISMNGPPANFQPAPTLSLPTGSQFTRPIQSNQTSHNLNSNALLSSTSNQSMFQDSNFNTFNQESTQAVRGSHRSEFTLNNNFNNSIPVHQNINNSSNLNWASNSSVPNFRPANEKHSWNSRAQLNSYNNNISIGNSHPNSESFDTNSMKFNGRTNFIEQQHSKLGCYSPSNAKPFQSCNSRFELPNRSYQKPSRIFSETCQPRVEGYNKHFNNQRGGYCKKTFEKTTPLFSCDTCDRGFQTESEFKNHVAEHVTCNIRNCQFQAHPKIVAIHKKMQHDTGYAEAISKLKNADEIAKWRAERKRLFPTAENILKRKAEQAEREARGEVIETKEFGQFKRKKAEDGSNVRNKRFRSEQRNRRFVKREYQHAIARTPQVTTVSDSDSDDDSHIKIHPFLGMKNQISTNDVVSKEESGTSSEQNVSANSTSALVEEDDDVIICLRSEGRSKDLNKDCEVEVEVGAECNGKDRKRALSDNLNPESAVQLTENVTIDSDNEAPEEVPINKGECDPVSVDRDVQQLTDVSDDEAPEEIPIQKSISDPTLSDADVQQIGLENDDKVPTENKSNEISNSVPSEQNSCGNTRGRKSGRGRNRDFKNKQPYVPPVRLSLLEKLLASDIRHERNVIMQCIRHIVKEKFFDDK